MAETNRVPEERQGADIRELGREVYNMADETRRDVTRQLYETANTIRTRTRETQGEVRASADRIVRNLEQTASNINSRAVDQWEEATTTMSENIWQTTAFAFILGVIVGLLLSRRS